MQFRLQCNTQLNKELHFTKTTPGVTKLHYVAHSKLLQCSVWWLMTLMREFPPIRHVLYLPSSQNLFQFTPLQEYYRHNFHNNFQNNFNDNFIKITSEMNDILFSFMVSDSHKIQNVWKYCWEDWITHRTADSCCFIYTEHIFLDKIEHIYPQSFFNMHAYLANILLYFSVLAYLWIVIFAYLCIWIFVCLCIMHPITRQPSSYIIIAAVCICT